MYRWKNIITKFANNCGWKRIYRWSEEVAREYINKIKQTVDVELIHSKKGLGNALIKGLKIVEMIGYTLYLQILALVILNWVTLPKKLYKDYDLFIGSKSHKDSEILE